MTSRRRGATPDQSGSPSVTGRPSRWATTNGSASTPPTSAPTRSSGRLVGAVSGRTWATHHHAPVFSGTHSVRSAKERSASSCQSATSRRAWSTWSGRDAGPRVRRSERLLMVVPERRSAAAARSRRVAVVIPPVVDQSWWQAHRDSVVLADVRWYLDGRSGRAAYDAGHLPGAVFVDLDRWLAAAAQSRGRPPPARRRRRCSPRAWRRSASATTTRCSPTTTAAGTTAARLVWMLRATGHDAALLDGGLTAYDGPLETAAVVRPPASFTPRPWPAERLADADDALDPATVVLDARAAERFRGERRAGRSAGRAHPGCPQPAGAGKPRRRPAGSCPPTSCGSGSRLPG